MPEGIARGLVVIPAYNEEANVGQVVRQVRTQLPDADIVVVDDCSRDGTARAARAASAIVLRHPVNLGDGAARQTGFKYAQQGNYDWVVQLDGDGQHRPESIPHLLAPILDGSADLVIGSRFLGAEGYQVQASRRLGQFLFGAIASLVTRQQITDPTSGFRALSRKVVNYFCTDVYPQQYPDADVLITAYYAGFRLKEVPAQMRQSTTGQTIHRGLRPLYYIYKMGLSIFVTLLRGRQVR
ncbi:MAG: glycosyltransferase family 2 protein [Anaerolineae bacterium]|nr:glycosyltransferase family 2 protein [Anaerolineae bacterium]